MLPPIPPAIHAHRPIDPAAHAPARYELADARDAVVAPVRASYECVDTVAAFLAGLRSR